MTMTTTPRTLYFRGIITDREWYEKDPEGATRYFAQVDRHEGIEAPEAEGCNDCGDAVERRDQDGTPWCHPCYHARGGEDPEADPAIPEDEELAYALSLSEKDAMTLAHFIRHLDRRGSVTTPSDIREVVARVYERENEKHLGRNGR